MEDNNKSFLTASQDRKNGPARSRSPFGAAIGARRNSVLNLNAPEPAESSGSSEPALMPPVRKKIKVRSFCFEELNFE